MSTNTKNSMLLEYLLEQAQAETAALGKAVLTKESFVLAVMKAALALANNSFVIEGRSEEERGGMVAELEKTCTLFSRYDFDLEKAIKRIEKSLFSTIRRGGAFNNEVFLFKMTCTTTALRVSHTSRDEVGAYDLLEEVLENPSILMGRCGLGISNRKSDAESHESGYTFAEEAPKDGDEPDFSELMAEIDALLGKSEDEEEEKDSDDDDDDFLSSLFSELDDDDEEESEDREETAEVEEPEGVKGLSEIVGATRNIQSSLLSNVYGQDQAVNAFVSGYFQARLMSRSRKETQKPQATFLFAGPPGVGKTFLAETAAEALKLPYRRFDMSEYSDKEANLEFCGSDKVYKNGNPGNVTDFVAKNPRCVLLFDEIEKAHVNIIYLFLQILDAGRLRDNFTDEEVSFRDAIIIFTTNAGKNLYGDPTIVNLASLPRKKILRALTTDINSMTGAPMFPAAICSRFASGNVVMFNRLDAGHLYTIAERELDRNVKSFEEAMGIRIRFGERVPGAIMFSEGGKADARTVKGRANAFFHEELYELLRLLPSEEGLDAVEKLTDINITVPVDELDGDIAALFENPHDHEVLIFADGKLATDTADVLDEKGIRCHITSDLDSAMEMMFDYDISLVLCDVGCGVRHGKAAVLNAEDVESDGHDFLNRVLEKYDLPVYLLQMSESEISGEEFLSFAKAGVRDAVALHARSYIFADRMLDLCRIAYRQTNMLRLARENKALTYKTSQTLSEDGHEATIRLFGFRLNLITDMEDSKNILDSVSRPDIHFDDVIGAEDAKEELRYFVSYLKNPIQYMRRGVKSPKGVLLYGPPGTGKTLLAKAMAGESGVTFLAAEGNEFLKRFVGEGSGAVHALFNAARKYAPAIVFIDEIDAIGKNRAASGEGIGDVLTAFLTEMDGFNTDTSKPVFVLAATNYNVAHRGDNGLDPALLRRFDRRIYVDLPNKEERRRYLRMKIEKQATVKLSDEQMENIAVRSTGMSLAELESVFEMALRNAIRSETGAVGDAEFEEAFEAFNGGEKRQWNPETLKRTARHEAGHALVCWLSGEKPSYLTIVARGNHGGYMQHSDNEDKGVYTREELLARIRTALAGRAAELVYYGATDGLTTGASGDLETATKVAAAMICQYGMDEKTGLATFEQRNAVSARGRINEMLKEELENAVRLIEENREAMDEIVDALVERNYLGEKAMDDIFSRTTKKCN